MFAKREPKREGYPSITTDRLLGLIGSPIVGTALGGIDPDYDLTLRIARIEDRLSQVLVTCKLCSCEKVRDVDKGREIIRSIYVCESCWNKLLKDTKE